MKKRLYYAMFVCLLFGCTTETQEQTTSSNYCDGDSGTCSLTTSSEDIEDSTYFQQITMEEAIELFKNKGDGILYFGYPDCPWCQEAQPILEELAETYDKQIYYIRTRDSEKNKLYTDEEKEQIMQYIQDYEDKDDDGEYQIYVPLVLSVKEGSVIKGHLGTVEEHDANERTMTDSEQKEVAEIYTEILLSLDGI